MGADVNEKGSGFHWAYGLVAILVGCLLLWFVPGWVLGAVGHWTRKTAGSALNKSQVALKGEATTGVVTQVATVGPGGGLTNVQWGSLRVKDENVGLLS